MTTLNLSVIARKDVKSTRVEHRFDVWVDGRLIADALPISGVRRVLAHLDVEPQEAHTLIVAAKRAA